jgi:shikimate dehydrogenase
VNRPARGGPFVTTAISGDTLLAGVTGRPLAHTLSPAMHNAAYDEMGLDWLYIPLGVENVRDLPALADALRVLPFVGLNVTMPFKEPMLQLCDEVATFAQVAGAVNTVHVVEGRLIGYNTDGRGLVDSLAVDAAFDPAGRDIVLVGAGGAAAAAVMAFALQGAASVTVANRTFEAAEELVGRLAPHVRTMRLEAVGLGNPAEEAVRAADLLVNATPVGMRPDDPSPIPPEWLHAGQVVADMVYKPAVTPLLAAATAVGATAVGGLGMLVAQGAVSIEIWNGDSQQPAPRETMRRAALEALAAQSPDQMGRDLPDRQ